MAIFSRTKRVTDPLDDDAKARILSSHDSILDQESPELCELVHGFLEDGPDQETFYNSDTDMSQNPEVQRSDDNNEEILKKAINVFDSDPYRNLLLAHVLRAVGAYSGIRSRNKSVFREKVASFLQGLGHDAAICVSKWNSTTKLTNGSYEFIDVVYKTDVNVNVRYFVDLDFASEFEIARPTRQYERVFQLLPNVFVGKEENLKMIVRELCDATKRSMKSRGLSLPPWRRSSYLQHKWFGRIKEGLDLALECRRLRLTPLVVVLWVLMTAPSTLVCSLGLDSWSSLEYRL